MSHFFFFSTQHGIFKICSHCDVDISFFAPDHCLIFHGEFPATHPPWVGMKDASTSHTRNDAGTDAVFLGTSLGGSVENFSGAVFQEEGHGVVHITPFTSTLSKAHVFFFPPAPHCRPAVPPLFMPTSWGQRGPAPIPAFLSCLLSSPCLTQCFPKYLFVDIPCPHPFQDTNERPMEYTLGNKL